jgi:prepilin-type N-terminal cleavage/methylation domain-containing protein
MSALPGTGRLGVNVQGARAAPAVLPRGFAEHALFSPVFALRAPATRQRGCRFSGFTLLELLIVLGIVAMLMLLIAPAFTTIKSGWNVTSAAYTVKGVLDTARTYAKANNTYTWVGFYEEDVSQPSVTPALDPLCPNCVGRLVMSIVASKDGTCIYNPYATGTENFIDPTRLTQIGKLVKIDNIHLPLFVVGTGTVPADSFDNRPTLQNDPVVGYNDSRFGELNSSPTAPTTNTKFPFQYPVGNPPPTWQYRFRKTLQFSPTGECRINSTYDMRAVIEIGLLQTHGNVTSTPSPTPGQYPGNVAAVQITGLGGNAKIYQR